MLKHVYVGIIKRRSKKLSRVKTMRGHCGVENRIRMLNILEHLVRYIIIAMAIWQCSHRVNYILAADTLEISLEDDWYADGLLENTNIFSR